MDRRPLTPILGPSTLGLHHLIPDEIPDNGEAFVGLRGEITLEELFNFDIDHWTNIYNGYAMTHLDEELELCELLNRDAATDSDGVEIDVDEMTSDILTG